MDNSLSGTEEQSFRSPPRRRRSTFFERRDSIAPYEKSDNETNKKEADAYEDEEYINHMNTYYLKLVSEKDAWKKEVTERRNKYHDLKVQYQITASAATSSSKSTVPFGVLTNEDIEFIKAKPDISKLVDAQQKLHKSLLVTRELVKRVNELDNFILSHSEETVCKVTNYILENSTIEPLE